MVINRTLARMLWPGEEAVGRRIGLGPGDTEKREVVGVIRDVRAALDAVPEPQIYAPYAQVPWPFGTLIVRSALPPASLADGLGDDFLTI